jgi:hypothetical protein
MSSWRRLLENKRHRATAKAQLAACRRLLHKRARQRAAAEIRGEL